MTNKFFNNKYFVILIHKDIDGDCIGSSIATKAMIESSGGQADIVSSEPVPENYKWLGTEFINKFPETYDSVIVLDTPVIDRINMPLPKEKQILVIDHHPTDVLYGDFNIIDTDSPSTGAILETLRLNMNLPITTKYANAILVSIISDTRGYATVNTDKISFDLTSAMIDAGADFRKAYDMEFNSRTPAFLHFVGWALSNIEYSEDNKIAGFTVPSSITDNIKKENIQPGEIMVYTMMVPTVEFGYALYEKPDSMVSGSLRSRTLSVNKIAETLGGGGHDKAAGFRRKGTLQEVKDKMLIELIKNL